MYQRDQLEISKKIIISLSSKLRALKNEIPELLGFVEKLEGINFSQTQQLVPKINISKEILTLLNSICWNFSQKQFEGFDSENIAKFNWTNIYDGLDEKQSFISGMFASRLLGLDGYYNSNYISAGLMLMQPGVVYPLHTHSVKEFYYCLSGRLRIQHDIDGEKFILGAGKISITPAGKLHSLEVIGNRPVLLIYSWLGDLYAPIRIWQKNNVDRWEGYIWRRLPGQKWKKSDLKQLSNKAFWEVFGKYS